MLSASAGTQVDIQRTCGATSTPDSLKAYASKARGRLDLLEARSARDVAEPRHVRVAPQDVLPRQAS
eukprot:806056-Pleurochrysis_carterae.AAC.3